MKIPKIVLQTSTMRLPKYRENQLKMMCDDFEYYHFKDNEFEDYIKEHPITDFSNSLEIFSKLDPLTKSVFFRIYFLYLNGGVFVNENILLEQKMDVIAGEYTFFSVQSVMNQDKLFDGFIGCIQNHIIVKQTLKHLHETTDYANISSFIKKLYDSSEQLCLQFSIQPTQTLFKEAFVDETIATSLNDKGEVLFKHYFNGKTIIPPTVTIPDAKKKSAKTTKIGVTFDVPPDLASLFSNGIRQNVLYFTELLLNVGYDVHLIIRDSQMQQNSEAEIKKMLYSDKFKITPFTEILNVGFDLIFTFGFAMDLHTNKTLQIMKTKHVGYFCGNSYIINTEKILYNQHRGSYDQFEYLTEEDKIYDEIWSIPQMANTNKHYWKVFHRCDCKEVPFVWSNVAIDLSQKLNPDQDLLYKKRELLGDKRRVAIFEPNISIMKWALPSILICEQAYRKYNNIEKLYITNVLGTLNVPVENKINDFNLQALNNIVQHLDLFRDKRAFVEGRFNTLDFMAKRADIVVSHQWENPLNYLYLDLAWMGWPIVHNAHLCKDIGYYYDQFDYDEGAEVLSKVMLEHDLHCDEYLEKNRKLIDRYLPSNAELQKHYKGLIDMLFVSSSSKKKN